jgi:hypothetical protein
MPANLNALIRYKQIDRCLKNPFVDCTIQKMQELCSEALGEFRGIYKQVSERTIRDDIRVMRSEMLGFNAPIEFKDGVYYYTDKDYSIFNVPVSETNLLIEIYMMLKNEFNKLPAKEVTTLLNKIALIINKEPMEEYYGVQHFHNSYLNIEDEKDNLLELKETKKIKENLKINENRDISIKKSISYNLPELLDKFSEKLIEETKQPAKDEWTFTWGQVLEVLGKH